MNRAQRRRRRVGRSGATALAVAASALGTVQVADAQAAPAVRAAPGLQPAFDPDVSDYVTRCTGSPVFLRVYAPGQAVTVDGARKRSGLSFSNVALQENQGFKFTVGAKTYSVRCLPKDFPQFTIRKYRPTQVGYMLITPGVYNAMFDGNGVPVWWKKEADGHAPIDFKRLPDGTFASYDYTPQTLIGFGSKPADGWRIFDLDGVVDKEIRYQGSPTDLHELQQRANGNYFVQSYVRRDGVDLTQTGLKNITTAMDAGIQELTPDGKTIKWSWNSKDHTALNEMGRWGNFSTVRPLPDGGPLVQDVRHLNAIQELPDGNLLLSMRHTDSIYKISKTTGEVIWKLGGTPTAKSLRALDPKNLTDPATDFGGQHDVRVLPNGDVTIYDNGTNRGRPPRAMRYTIDEAAGTATLQESVEDSEATNSQLVGSSRKLPGGNWVVNWGGIGLMTETTATGEPVIRVKFRGVVPYRAEPIEKGVLPIEEIRAGMDAQHPRG